MATYFPANALTAEDVTKTVGAAGDFATIQAAINWFKGKIIVGSCVIQELDSASYDEAVTFADLYIGAQGSLVLRGDSRALAGISYTDNMLMNQQALANGGSGTCSLTTDGTRTQITVTGTVANPDFNAGSWVNGDGILVYADDGVIYTRVINSISPGGAGNHVIEITVALPVGATLGNSGTAICLKPDRAIARTVAGRCVFVKGVKNVGMSGWFLDTHTGADCHGIAALYGSTIACSNIVTTAEDYGFFAQLNYSTIKITTCVSAWGCTMGVYADAGSIDAYYVFAVKCTYNFVAGNVGYVKAGYSCSSDPGTRGYWVSTNSVLYAFGASASIPAGTTGYYAQRCGYLYAISTNARAFGAGTKYNPAVSCTPGNCEGVIEWS